MLLADRGYDADWIRIRRRERRLRANISPKNNRNDPIYFSLYLYRAHNRVVCFFNNIKHCRRVATRYNKLAADSLHSSNLRQSGCRSLNRILHPQPGGPV